ncbi:MAG: galactosyldiacylglycerol synthase [Bacillales bacterium]|jgi:UDP-N-acetylglucosamine:LPS N-acetylglucosamine transferase|nr:galactosyldiacylglycerol synthase [Bacillales bacterium]
MKKILFFPLLRLPSGHHQVADTIAGYLKNRDFEVDCKKIDLLSEWNSVVESIVTNSYLKWIHHSPKTYAWIYKQMAYTSESGRSYKYYDFLFLNKMKQILADEKPDLIICTHGFPSYFLNLLKSKNECNVPVINVYTDFFINDVWGKQYIDYHFVPNLGAKDYLINTNRISEEKIIVTGIPTNEAFDTKIRDGKNATKISVLLSGGSVGLGNISEILQKSKNDNIEFYVLSGKNKKLLHEIELLNSENIHPLPYISSREEMNELYSKVDAIVTKPGGGTISEALKKGLPIFVNSALPGQEEINLNMLIELNLVQKLDENKSLDEQITEFFNDKKLVEQFQTALQQYLTEIAAGNPDKISELIQSLIYKSPAND